MPLYIRDDRIDDLAARLQAVSGARTKTETVRVALERELARHAQPTLGHGDKIERILAMVSREGRSEGGDGDRTAFLYDDHGLPQ